AEKAGLLKGDEITFINNRSTQDMTLEKLTGYFYDDSGEELKIIVNRNGIERKFRLILKSPIE
ncbi:MAG: signaling protein, partial [Flavobacteriaceae bacterium]|nr:signaling protein [Flavobacteriaceae bacterium]